ncbi:MAG: aspartate ammonia-lyase [Syntrophorhabdaceae bacterium]|nr:aspartate ammonia-lyase [Syntrophorhabdaceae bacterium]
MSYRIERDLLGEMEVPADAYYGIHTVRALKNFPISDFRIPEELIIALAQVKEACARANIKTGLMDEKIGNAIIKAAREIQEASLLDQFPIDPFQGGAGTSTNMNMNEVIANRAIEHLGGKKGDYSLVHPIDHVNLSQSTNDVYPTSVKVAAIKLVIKLSETLAKLQGALQKKESEFAGILKLGRTEMQDAVPIALGQEFGAYAEAIARDRWRLFKVEERLRQVNLGGTAIGTGLNARREYIFTAIEELQDITGLGIARAENMVDVTQNADVFVEVSGLIKTSAVNLCKIAGDLRLLSSGPLGGIGEIILPQRQEGSSIMPNKVNPVVTEMITQVSFQVMGADYVITNAASQGQLELNAFIPVIAFNLINELKLMINASEVFRTHCVEGIMANIEGCKRWFEESLCLVTALAPYIGHEKAGELARKAQKNRKTIREMALEMNLFTEEELDIIFSPQELIRPGIPGEKKIKKDR